MKIYRHLHILVILIIGLVLLAACEQEEKTSDTMGSTTAGTTTTPKPPVESNYCEPKDNRRYLGHLSIEYTRMACRLTGQQSLNKTFTNYGFGRARDGMHGTDLGIPVYDEKNDKMYIFFGDTLDVGLWRSNIVAFSTDFDPSDGILFDDMLTGPGRVVQAVIEGKHNPDVPDGKDGKTRDDGREVTKIPTGGIAIDGVIYMHFMSIREWNSWFVNYNGVVKSTDGGKTWTLVESMHWDQDEAYNFGQIFPIQDKEDPEMIYIYGIPGGRSGGVKLGRVHQDHYENMAEYEYFTGKDSLGEPIWVKGSAGLKEINNNHKGYIFNGRGVGEHSVMYNAYLGKWMIAYLEYGMNIVYRTTDNHWGDWSVSRRIVSNADPGLHMIYGAFMHEKYTKENGKIVYFIMSQYDPFYDSWVMEMVLR